MWNSNRYQLTSILVSERAEDVVMNGAMKGVKGAEDSNNITSTTGSKSSQ